MWILVMLRVITILVYAIETEYLLFKTKFLQGLHLQLTVGITYPSAHAISAENCYSLTGQAPVPIWEMESFVLWHRQRTKETGVASIYM